MEKVNRKPYEWRSEYEVNLPFLDNHHRKFLEIINMLIEDINQDMKAFDVNMIFHKLFFLSENYFIDEEIYFKRYNYPNYNEHKGSHKGFLEKIAGFYNDYNNQKFNPQQLLDYLESWFNNHILLYDREAVDFLNKKLSS